MIESPVGQSAIIFLEGGSMRMADFLFALAAYLIGTIPSAYLFGRFFKGIDIRQAGSGNVGAVNSFKQTGFLSGILTLCADIAKGAAAVYICESYGSLPVLPVLSVFLVILGHNYNIFLGFKGGKGLASLLGSLLILSPITIPYVLSVMIIIALICRDTNTAAGLGILSLPIFLVFDKGGWVSFLIGMAISLLIMIKHLRDFRAYLQGRRELV